ncbi:hypothetical protein Droror1_Dr00025791 [Drosera rotundifolia]
MRVSNTVFPFDFLLTEKLNGSAVKVKMSSFPEILEAKTIFCFNGGGSSLGRRVYGTSHLDFSASVMCTLKRSSVSCINGSIFLCPDHVPRKVRSDEHFRIQMSVKDRLESLTLARRSASDLTFIKALSGAEKDGSPMRVKIRLPKSEMAARLTLQTSHPE